MNGSKAFFWLDTKLKGLESPKRIDIYGGYDYDKPPDIKVERCLLLTVVINYIEEVTNRLID